MNYIQRALTHTEQIRVSTPVSTLEVVAGVNTWIPWHTSHGYPNMSLDIHGIYGIHIIHRYPWTPRIAGDSMDIHADIHRDHGIHSSPWIPWISIDIHGIHWHPWISMEDPGGTRSLQNSSTLALPNDTTTTCRLLFVSHCAQVVKAPPICNDTPDSDSLHMLNHDMEVPNDTATCRQSGADLCGHTTSIRLVWVFLTLALGELSA